MTIETSAWTPIFGVFYKTKLFDTQSEVDYLVWRLVWRIVATPVEETTDVVYGTMLDKLGDDLKKESQVLFQ